MTEVKAGMRLRNNDKRWKGETITVISVTPDHAYYHTGQRKAKIARHRIFPVGSSAQRGYTVVEGPTV